MFEFLSIFKCFCLKSLRFLMFLKFLLDFKDFSKLFYILQTFNVQKRGLLRFLRQRLFTKIMDGDGDDVYQSNGARFHFIARRR